MLAGVCFISPAMLIVLALAWAYVRYGSTPAAGGILYGVLPVVIAIVAQALWGLGQKAVKGWLTGVAGVAVVGLYFLHVNILVLLLAAGLLVMLGENWRRLKTVKVSAILLPLSGAGLAGGAAAAAAPFSLLLLFLNFLKIGSVLYGSGYVLLAFLRADFVTRLGWLTDKQLIDAIAVGQVTPGPVFTTATFIGYLLGGLPGALLATLGIFLPSFIFRGHQQPVYSLHPQFGLGLRLSGRGQRGIPGVDAGGHRPTGGDGPGRPGHGCHCPGQPGAAFPLSYQQHLADRRQRPAGAGAGLFFTVKPQRWVRKPTLPLRRVGFRTHRHHVQVSEPTGIT